MREHIEAEQQARATERIVERRVIGGCPACVPPHSVRAADAASCPAPAEASLPSVPGNVILEERIIERAMAQRARRQLDLATAEEEASAGHSERQRIERPLALRWRLSVLAGYAWSDGEPVYGLAAGARVIGPFELGAWGIMSAELRGAAGLSVGLRW